MHDLHLHGEACGCQIQNLKYRPPDTGPIVIMRQPLEPFVLTALDAVPTDMLPQLRLTGRLQELRESLIHGFVRCRLQPDWLADWLVGNVLFQARLFSELTHTETLQLRLEKVDDDGCCRFHTDNVRHRLVCTYRGPGTEWIEPKLLTSVGDGTPADPASVRQLERGAIALMRGSKGATPDRPGLLHRSPPIESTGLVRLLLAIDAVDQSD